MSKKKSESIALEPGFAKPEIGDVVAVEAVDWGIFADTAPFTAR
jgi:hypothetical protein